MLTWAVAFALRYGALQGWFWMAMPFDFLITIALIQTIKDYIKVRTIEATTSQLFTKVCND